MIDLVVSGTDCDRFDEKMYVYPQKDYIKHSKKQVRMLLLTATDILKDYFFALDIYFLQLTIDI